VSLFHRQLVLEATGFYFKINNALVTRKDSSNADYYVNAGNTKQRGLELSASYARIFNNSFVRSFTLKPAYTFSDFIYGDFVKGTIDYSGKTVPSVPKNVLSIYGDIQFRPGMYINATYYSASSIWLDDANTAKADPYHLLGCRVGWKFVFTKIQMQVYAGGENLLDETYSLGNDINAAGGRYYNAAAARNYYAGLAVQFGGERGR
jgi:iron complex outermembrane receptor protein